MTHHVMPIRTAIAVYIALLVLLVATVGASQLPLGSLHFAVAMVIATIKGALIVWYFMHVQYSHRLTLIVAVASFFWLGILLLLTLGDYMTRNTLAIPGK